MPTASQAARVGRITSAHPPMSSAPRVARNVEQTQNFVYFGGHVISHPEIVVVFWGATGVPATATQNMETFYKQIVASPFMDWMGEYDTAGKTPAAGGTTSNQHINRGSFKSTVTITPVNTAKTLLDSDIGTELVGQIAAGKLPVPTIDAEGGVDTLYVIHFPTGVIIDDGAGASSCNKPGAQQAFCGYHGAVTASVAGAQQNISYSVIPDLTACGGGCGNTALEAYTITGSHELAEATTDPEIGIFIQQGGQQSGPPMSWYDDNQQTGGEIGDVCADPGDIATIGSFTVQTIWSQRLGKCIATDPALPLCTGTTRPCKQCSAGDCSGATPACDTDPKSTTQGKCVECAANTDCKPAKQVCDTTAHTCKGCSKDADCTGATSKCDTSSGACIVPPPPPPPPPGSSGSSGTSGSGGDGGANNADGTTTTTTTTGCAMSPSEGTGAAGFVGVFFGLAALQRRRRRR